jgi:hypothetical protein
MSRYHDLCHRLEALNAEYFKALMIPLVRDRSLAFAAVKKQADEIRAELERLASDRSPDHSQERRVSFNRHKQNGAPHD